MLPETMMWGNGCLHILDQRRIPWDVIYTRCTHFQDVANAIETLQVRGAPAIGIAAAYGVVLAAKEGKEQVIPAIERLEKTRPTAVNLFWSLERMKKVFLGSSPSCIYEELLSEASNLHSQDIAINRLIGHHGEKLLPDHCSVLTHCNAGALATGGHGTALGIIRTARERGKKIEVFADETRPVLQGARLTVWELMQDQIDVTLVCDNMAAAIMKSGKIQAVIVGADRIASNGDVANKIGTYQLAIISRYHSVPFYVAAPLSTFDWTIPAGDQIPIEERGSQEILQIGMKKLPPDYCVFNPAFDVTPSDLVSAIITEKGLVEEPVSVNIKQFKAESLRK